MPSASDAAAPTDGGASPTAEASPGAADDASACSCRVVAAPRSSRSGLLALAACGALILAARRRRALRRSRAG
jgi:hypothetical protein